jgi:uncharacterized protein
MDFEWDRGKEQANIARHGISFVEAVTVFGDPLELTVADPVHSTEEFRFVSIGLSSTGELLVVCYTERADRIRLISAPGDCERAKAI